MTEDIIFQSELDKQDMNQISEKKFQKLTDFELKILQRVRFWIKIFTTRQIFNQNIYNASDFDEKYFFKKHDFEEKNILKKQILIKFLRTKKSRFDSFYPVKWANFAFYVQF